MKENNIGKQLLTAAICAIFVFGIGYALLSDTITITGTASTTGTLDINVTSAEWASATSVGAGVNTDNTITINGNTKGVTIAANVLEYPGSTSTFTIELTNLGSLAAKVKSIVPQSDNANMTFSYNNLTTDSTIAANGGTLTFTVTVGWLSTSEEGFTSSPFSLTIEFEQQ